jgi:hypothetical protein
MTQEAKNILRRSINVFLQFTDKEKEIYIESVANNLNIHYNALNSIGIGYSLDTVQAGQIFLRIFNN